MENGKYESYIEEDIMSLVEYFSRIITIVRLHHFDSNVIVVKKLKWKYARMLRTLLK